MKPIYKYNVVILFVLLFCFSCGDFLHEDPKGKLAGETYFSTSDDLDMSIHALFNRVMESGQSGSKLGYAWMGDDLSTHTGSNKQDWREFDQFSISDNNGSNEEIWNSLYSVIKAANYIINNAERTPVTQEEIDQAIGQARFWRAYSYYKLVRVFGNIPLVVVEDVDYEISPSSVEEIYKLIVSDLEFCETKLPVSWTDAPKRINGVDVYITEGASKSLLAHVYLSMAGWPLKQTDKYAAARDKAKEVIDAVKAGTYYYELHTNFEDVYKWANNYSKESIISIYYNKSWGWDENCMSPLCSILESAGGWSDAHGEIRFWKNMPDGPRKNAIYAPKIYQSNSEREWLVDWWETTEGQPMFIMAAEGPNRTEYDYTQGAKDVDWLGEKSHKVFRYSELLLTYAEAQARADGTPNTLAYECVNAVRNRAGLNDLPGGLSGTDFADAVVAEHGWEVAGYYWSSVACRFFDMQRLELVEEYYNYRKENPAIEVAPGIMMRESVTLSGGSWNQSMMYAPYPGADKILNPNLMK